MFEDFSLAVRELLHRLTDRNDLNALRELIKLIFELSSKGDQTKLSLLQQLIHDEKTYILSDTEILRDRELELIKKALLYHVIFDLIRTVKEGVNECKLDVEERLREAISDGNLSDLSDVTVKLLSCVVQGREVDGVVNLVRKVKDSIELKEIKRPPDMKDHVMVYILENLIFLIDQVRVVREHVKSS